MRKDRMEIDRFDEAILHVVAGEGRISVTDLAQRIGLSKSPTHARLRRLEKSGVITGYRALVDASLLGVEHVSFVEVRLSDTREAALAEFNAAIAKVPEIEQAHLIAGDFDYLLKVRTHDMREYRRVLAEKISMLPYVANTSSYVAMQSIKENILADVI